MGINDPLNKVAARLTLDITPAQQQLTQLSEEMKQFNQNALQLTKQTGGGDTYLQNASGAVMNLRQQLKDLQLAFKEGTLGATDLYNKLLDLRNVYGNAGGLDMTTKSGILNDQALRSAIVNAQGQLSSLQDFEMQSELKINQNKLASYEQYLKQEEVMDKAHYMALQEDKKRDNQAKMQADKEYTAWWADQLKQQAAMAKAQQAEMEKQLSHGSVFNSISSKRTGGFTSGRMIAGMVGFEALTSMFEAISQGMKDVENGAAGIQQVFESQIKTQYQLNSVTNDAIGIAQKYGASITDVMDGLKLFGRQYKDTQTALTLLNSATLLSVVDNVNLSDANKALEATMNSLGLAAKTQADAYANSMRIVDSWSQLAHQASVSATSLMKATEAAGGAAHAVGVNFDQLNALATSAVRNTGMDGANIGNMLKSLFSSIETDKSAAALKQLDISLKQVGANGKEEFRPVFDVLLELSQKLQTTNDSQEKLLTTISGGKFQWSKVSSMLSDYNTIIDAYATSINSAGAATQYAQVQMNTFGRDLTRLRDTFVQLTAQTDQNGLGTFMKSIVEGLTNLIIGFEQLPPAAGQSLVVIGGLLIALKSLTAVMNTLSPLSQLLITGFQKLAPIFTATAEATTVETVATGELTAAFTALDVVSGGLALVIGAVVTGLALTAMHSGEAATATQQHTQALQDQIGVMQQQYNLAQQKQQFMQTAISQEQQLKQALDNHTLSAQQHNKVLNDMVDLYHAVGKATGDEALQQVNASNVNNHTLNDEQKAIDKLVQAKKTAYEDAVKINNQDVQNDLASTNQKIKDINNVIDGLRRETEAKMSEMNFWQSVQYTTDKIMGPIRNSLSFADDDPAKKAIDQSNLAADYAKKVHDQQLSDAESQFNALKAQQAQDEYKVASNNLDLFNVDTSGVGDSSSPLGVPPSGPTSASAAAKQITDALVPYNTQLKLAADNMQMYDTALRNSLTDLHQHMTSVKDVTSATAAYNSEMQAIKDHQSALQAENDKINQLLPTVPKLSTEYQTLTDTLDNNTKAMADDAQKMSDITNQVTSEITNMLQTAYQDQQKLEEDALTNTYQPQIDALTRQKDAVDALIQSLQAQWNQQSEVNKLTDLQNQLAAVQADKRFEIVGLDGKLSYTYDTAKAADLQKQIADQQTKMQHDAQIQQLNDQKTALDNEIKNLQDAYNTKKQQLDQYWQWKLSQDQLNQDADNLILKNGLTGALSLVEGYTSSAISKYNALTAAAAQAGQAIAQGLGGGGLGGASGLSLNSYWQNVKSQGGAYATPSANGMTLDQQRQHEADMYGISKDQVQVTPGGHTFVPWQYVESYLYRQQGLHMATGGIVPRNMGIQGADSVPAMLSPGEWVLSVPTVDNIMRSLTMPNKSGPPAIHINGNLEFPNVRDVNDMAGFLEGLTEMVGVHRN